MTGSLPPCVPDKFLIKYDPGRIVIIYHFENNPKEQFYREIDINIDTSTNLDDLCDFLFKSENYYLDLKIVKRKQVSGKDLILGAQPFKNDP
jgi:uncharacterized protein YqfB (UPF0267 family)